MKKAYLLTGEPKGGKTTALKKIIDGLGLERCGGFYTQELCAAGERYGFRLVVLGGPIGTLADITYHVPLKVGKYGVVLPFLENIGLAAVSQALVSKSFVVIDEIGPMQMCSPLFKLAVMDVLTSSIPLIGTIFTGSDPWSDELKQRSDVVLFPLTEDNRNEVPKTLIETLKSIEEVKQ
jgi:nucleoside-triphosphatase